ncbi:ATP-binding protein [Methanobrevibacter filiformis]|uniref:Putative AAA-ATPase n=1 Tax=Methanobrevibacter filiformis TaxID=55758 RepID=A0A165ZDG8_9EURY|nr:ATP-binding protein [Methanobrevibacter filiformis]KZX10578.1 putative AAA-ATPase [Methanobrevibacter filiformis]
MKKLPIGVATFSELIENNYTYIDKTAQIHRMVNEGKIYFLSRPRRFGKSLLVNTLENLFKGNKELFKGLYIYDKYDWTQNYPVIYLDFASIGHKNPETLERSLNDFINMTKMEHSIDLVSEDLTSKFTELIIRIHEKYDKKVVILIDEYDKAISSHLDDIEIAKGNRDVLRSFYQVLKPNDKHIHFIFVTGISKFTKTSIFSDFNNLDDITINPKYSNICGYTQKDLEENFKEYIDEISENSNVAPEIILDLIKKWYDGYSWDGGNFLYNPFSILEFFNNGKFNNYWFDTGTPKLLIDLIDKKGVDTEVLVNKSATFSGTFPSFKLENLDFATALLQTGYLTIKKEEETIFGESSEYKLAIPNKEVHDSLFSYILGTYTNYDESQIQPMTNKMIKYILNLDETNLQKSFEILLHKIPNILYGKLKKEFEAHYQILAISWLQLLGFDIEGEVMTIKGRMDAVLKQKHNIIIIEFKFSETESMDNMLNDGLNQIIKNEYYKPYQNKNVILLSVAFQPRNVKCKLLNLKKAFKLLKKV